MFLFIRSPLRVLGPHSSPRDISKSSSAELITTTTVNIAMKLKEFPQVMEFVSYEHTPFSTVGNGSCLPNFGHASAKHLKEYSAKRAKENTDQAIQAESSARVGLFKMDRGCSSALSTLSRDILLEIFSYLRPSDLVSLSHVNKDLRSLLLSHSSSVLWNTCFKLYSAPAPPTGDSPQAWGGLPVPSPIPSWVHLLFGGAYCYSCGAKPEDNTSISLRRRACKSCMAARLRCSSSVPQEFRDAIRSQLGNSASTVHQQTPCSVRHWWDEDVAAFEARPNVLQYPVSVSGGGTADVGTVGISVQEFLARKKVGIKAIREHALICDKDRITSRSSELSDVRVKRSEDIKSRFLQLGYRDLDQSRRHHEVRVGKPMSDRVWQRVEPLHRPNPEVNEVRDQRASLDESYGHYQEGSLVHGPSQVVMQAKSHWQDLVAPFDASAQSSSQPATGSKHEDQVFRLGSPSYQLESGRAPQGNGGPDYDHSHLSMRANPQDHVVQQPQLNVPSYQSPIGSAPETFLSKYSSIAHAGVPLLYVTPSQPHRGEPDAHPNEPVTPSQPQDEPDAQPDEAKASTGPACPVCGSTFGRAQERNRHVEGYFPHSIYCPSHGCLWTGRRQCDFREHWRKNHPKTSRIAKKTNEIYEPKEFVKSIVDGIPLVEVKQSVCSMVQERLERLGKVYVMAKMWSRMRKVDN